MKIVQNVRQFASPVADRNLFQYPFLGDNTVHLDTRAFLQASRGEEIGMEFFDGIVPARNTCGIWTSFAYTIAAFFFFLLPHSFLFAAVATEPMSTEEDGNQVRDGFVENSSWRHVENLYAMFDRLRQQFPGVIFQNCAGGGGRLDWGILHHFDNTELSDWMRAPRGTKILNGMTWVLPPEILLRTFGTEVPDLAGDGDIDYQLRQVEMSLPIFRGIAPSLSELNPTLRDKIRSGVEFYKRKVRPILRDSVVYHHTPLTPYFNQSPWLVLEYASPDKRRDVVTLFRTSNDEDPIYHFVPRGLDASVTYKVTFENRSETVELSGIRLMTDGIPVRLETTGTSEMLLFESVPANVKSR